MLSNLSFYTVSIGPRLGFIFMKRKGRQLKILVQAFYSQNKSSPLLKKGDFFFFFTHMDSHPAL